MAQQGMNEMLVYVSHHFHISELSLELLGPNAINADATKSQSKGANVPLP